MRLFLLTLLTLLLAPALARAEVRMTVQDVPLHGGRALAAARPVPRFNLVGLHWRGPGTVLFRVRGAGGWSDWQAADADSGPDPASREARGTSGWHDGNLAWTDTASHIQYRLSGRVLQLRAYFLWSPVLHLPRRTLSVAGSPPIVPRSGWGADESIVRAAPLYAPSLSFAVVHHTAGSNDYTPDQSAAIVRGIEQYHVEGNKWNDIGYNFLVDRFGQVFEGRAGGIDRPVIGAHSAGFNSGSVGVAVIGNFQSSDIPPAARDALVRLLAWRLDVAHVDPSSTVTVTSGGNDRFPAGVPVTLRAISGHRDTGYTDCPGNVLYAELPSIVQSVAQTGLPKLYEPEVAGAVGGKVRFTARLSAAAAWTVSVADATGAVVASGSGSGANVDWTWDATAATPGTAYRWTIAGPASLLPANGVLSPPPPAPPPSPAPTPAPAPSPAPPPLTGLIGNAAALPAVVSPDGDGIADLATISYALAAPAKVTATVTDANGAEVATLFTAVDRPAGRQSFRWSPATLPDGRHTVVLAAVGADGTQASASATVTVDRTLSALVVTPSTFSPNGDGRADTMTAAFTLAAAAAVTMDIRSGSKVVATPFAGNLDAGQQQIAWDGSTATGTIPDGQYTLVLTATDALATVSLSQPLTVDTRPPTLSVLSLARLRFSLDEPATVTLTVNGKRIVKVEPAGAFHVPFAGTPRVLRAIPWDGAGNAGAAVQARSAPR